MKSARRRNLSVKIADRELARAIRNLPPACVCKHEHLVHSGPGGACEACKTCSRFRSCR